MVDLSDKKPIITYPTEWRYKVILDEDSDEKIKNLLSSQKFKISKSKTSENNKFHSFDVEVCVTSEEQRYEIFDKLKSIAKFVL